MLYDISIKEADMQEEFRNCKDVACGKILLGNSKGSLEGWISICISSSKSQIEEERHRAL